MMNDTVLDVIVAARHIVECAQDDGAGFATVPMCDINELKAALEAHDKEWAHE